ncbi:tetratricopeptide repeat protein [Stieleria varia]|uniref:Uncharacterized protein n=1 Tax=Stieleria varia TaxID=2528005 RepID=A0A5C6A343_9BACT|nr:hypothetical protein [Stieleria varia]TWT93959.1 hypothetical protein Pla52n_57870 [Stieleria varia]
MIDKCVASEPTDRPSAAEVLTLLRTAGPKSDSLRAMPHAAIGRRRFGLALVGGAAGLVAAGYWISDASDELASIQTLAVLSFDDQYSSDIESGIPLGDRDMTAGERIAATLVNELSRIDQIGVLPFRPMKISPGDSYQSLGDKLKVDAFVAGSIRQNAGTDQGFVEVTLQIISSKSGNQLWSETLRRPADDCMLKHSGLAGEIAQRIGKRLTATVNQPSPPSRELYNCYVDGKARADIESVAGLRQSLMCFQQAHDAAPDSVDPLAAIVTTSLTLASQSSQSEANEYMQTALVNLQKAIQLKQETVELQLAKGAWEWQKLKHFDEAEKILGELSRRQPYHWQVQHQYGLLLAALSEDTLARKHLQDAALLNSMSLAVKVDRRRLDWFRGYDVEALSGTKTYLDLGTSDAGKSDIGKSDALARGLMVDILEQQGDYDRAGEVLRWETPALTEAAYYDRRSESLKETPYGLFGDRLNQVILDTRRGKELTAADLEDLQLGPFPMFPLLFARHPAFAPARLLPEAKQYLPNPHAV